MYTVVLIFAKEQIIVGNSILASDCFLMVLELLQAELDIII